MLDVLIVLLVIIVALYAINSSTLDGRTKYILNLVIVVIVVLWAVGVILGYPGIRFWGNEKLVGAYYMASLRM